MLPHNEDCVVADAKDLEKSFVFRNSKTCFGQKPRRKTWQRQIVRKEMSQSKRDEGNKSCVSPAPVFRFQLIRYVRRSEMMTKNLRKTLAILLSLTIAINLQCLPALAGDVTVSEESETITNPDGTETLRKTTVTTETDSESGKVTTTVTVEKTTNDTTEDGVKIEGEEFRTDTSVTDEKGNTLQESWHEK
jgi:hypothetical protein